PQAPRARPQGVGHGLYAAPFPHRDDVARLAPAGPAGHGHRARLRRYGEDVQLGSGTVEATTTMGSRLSRLGGISRRAAAALAACFALVATLALSGWSSPAAAENAP